MYVGDDESEADRCSDFAEMPPILGMRQFPASPSIAPFDWTMHDQRNYTLRANITRI